jgi:hypothetical protein
LHAPFSPNTPQRNRAVQPPAYQRETSACIPLSHVKLKESQGTMAKIMAKSA